VTAKVSAKHSEEIFWQEGENFRSVMVTLEPDGTLMLDAQDMGPLVQQVWGDSDYEFWRRVRPEAAGKLAFALLKKIYAGREQAVDELRALCVAEGVACENGSYA
jgi:hypothetical protein